MNKIIQKSVNRKLLVFSTMFISSLILLASTAVPQTQGKVITDQIDRYEQLRTYTTLLTTSDESSPAIQKLLSPFWQILFSWLLKLFKNTLMGLNGIITPDGDGNGFSGRFSGLLSILMNIIMTLFKFILKGIVSVVSTFVKIIGSIILLFILMLLKLQTNLTSGAVFLMFIGIVSKITTKVLSALKAPLQAIIAALISLTMGSLVGSLSFVLLALLSVVTLFAIPIGIVAAIAILLLSLSGENLTDIIDSIIEFIQDLIDGGLQAIQHKVYT